MDLADLRVLVTVAETGSVSAASRRLRLALGAVSARLRGLETELGQPLFVREARGMRPTPAGELAVARARGVLAEVERLREELRGGGEVRGRVRIQASTMAVAEHLPSALGAVLARHPALELHVEERPSVEVLRALEAGRADLGVVSGVRIPRSWRQAPFARDRLVALLPGGHPLAGRPTLALAELVDEPFVGLEEGTGIQRFVEGAAERGGRPLRVVVRVRAFDAVVRMVAAGAGVAVLPASSARRLADARVRVVDLADPWAERELWVCLPPGAHPAAVEATWDALTGGTG